MSSALIPVLRELPSSFHLGVILLFLSSQDLAMAGVRPRGSVMDVESPAAVCGHCFCRTAPGGHLQQEVRVYTCI